MKKIVLFIFLILISGCSNISQNKIEHTPIEKINLELELFEKNSNNIIYFIQQKHDSTLRIDSITVESNPNGRERIIIVRPISDFEVIDYRSKELNTKRLVLTLVYVFLLDNYYLLDSRNQKVIDEKGYLVDMLPFFAEKALPLLT